MFKILSLDGGGIRSIFQARLIERIEEATGKKLSPNMIAGTSGGAIVGAALTRMSASETVSFFQTKVGSIFKKGNLVDEIGDLWNLKGAKYENTALKKALKEVFFDHSLRDIDVRILITSFALVHPDGNWQPVVFHNFPVEKASPNLSIVDALLRSSAAPTYFPVYQKHADGGIWGNNPSMSAVAAAVDRMVGKIPFSELSVLSIGTGILPNMLRGSKNDMGALDWFQKGMLDMLLDNNVPSSHYYTQSILGPSYYRVKLDLAHEIKLDDATKMHEMITLADSWDLRPILEWMQGFWV